MRTLSFTAVLLIGKKGPMTFIKDAPGMGSGAPGLPAISRKVRDLFKKSGTNMKGVGPLKLYGGRLRGISRGGSSFKQVGGPTLRCEKRTQGNLSARGVKLQRTAFLTKKRT